MRRSENDMRHFINKTDPIWDLHALDFKYVNYFIFLMMLSLNNPSNNADVLSALLIAVYKALNA